MKRKFMFALPAIGLVAVSCNSGKQAQRPNILLIVADDLGMGDLGAYGGTAIHTPNIDSLATGGILFENGYATSSTSTPCTRHASSTVSP